MTDREYKVLIHIRQYCAEIDATVKRYGNTLNDFLKDLDYKKSVTLTILQIGELSSQLSDEFRADHPDIPWREIRGIRNIIAHHYGTLDDQIVFETSTVDVPNLERFVDRLIAEHEARNKSNG